MAASFRVFAWLGASLLLGAVCVAWLPAGVLAQTPPGETASPTEPKPVDAGAPLANLGQVMRLLERGRVNEAVGFLEEITRSKVGGADRRLIVQSKSSELHTLASLYSGQGRYAASEKLFREIIRFGDENAKVLAGDKLADVLSNLGRIDDARILWEDNDKASLAADLSAFNGPWSMLAALRAAKLARAYAGLGRRDQAEKFAERARSILAKRGSGTPSPITTNPIFRRNAVSEFGSTAVTLSSVSVHIAASIEAFDLDAAIASQTVALKDIEGVRDRLEALQREHQTQPIEALKTKEDLARAPIATCAPCLLLNPLGNLGRLFERKGDLVAAEAQYRRAYEINVQLYGPRSPHGITVNERLAGVLALQDDGAKLVEAVQLRQTALDLRLASIEPANLGNIRAMEQLAALKAKAGDVADADALRLRASAARAAANQKALQDPDHRYHREIKMIFGTNRARDASDPRSPFGAGPSSQLAVGLVDVRAPYLERKPGTSATPARLAIPGTSMAVELQSVDPLRHFEMRSAINTTRQEALFNAREALTRAEVYKDTAIIFVHGFQTRFDEASLWFAQIMEDIGFDGAAFLFSWPSKGELSSSAYNADIDRARNSRKALIQFFDDVVQPLGAKRIHIVAHSMGNLVLLTALRDMRQRQLGRDGMRATPIFDQLILAAPDVERGEFLDLWQECKGIARSATLYAASTDFAMMMSRKHRGNDSPRAGDVPAELGPVVAEGLESIDVSALARDFFSLNHASFAEKPQLLDDVRTVLHSGHLAAERAKPSNMTRHAQGYWQMIPLP